MTTPVVVLDSSAVLAVLFQEPERDALLARMAAGGRLVMSAANVLECVLRLAPTPAIDASPALDALLALYAVDIRPIDLAQLTTARMAFLTFGKGRHPARLNFGDCFAYALARTLKAPLLFVGDDFVQTDVASV